MNLTLEEIENWGLDVSETLEKIKSYEPQYPQRPSKPMLAPKHSTEDVLEYSKKLETYDACLEEYKLQKSLYNEICGQLNSLKEEFIKNYTDFYKVVPKSKQSKVWWKAWEDGHSYGYYEVYLQLDSLVELFED